MIDKFMHGFLNRVYGYDDYTQLEINSKLIQKIDEVIDECNNAFEFVDWLKEQGVPDEVQTIMDIMLEDGTLEKLINIEKLNQISSQLSSSINQLTNETENKVNQMKTTLDNRIISDTFSAIANTTYNFTLSFPYRTNKSLITSDTQIYVTSNKDCNINFSIG